MSDIAKMIAIAKKFGGGSSTPAPVVILPETELTLDGGMGYIFEPLGGSVSLGDVCRVNYNGTDYECTARDGSWFGQGDAIALGNVDTATEGAVTGGNTDAPFVVILFASGITDNGITAYGMCADITGASACTISIVQIGEASADSGSDGGGVFTVRATQTMDNKLTDIDKSFAEGVAAFQAGKYVHLLVSAYNGEAVYNYPVTALNENGIVFMLQVGADIFWAITWNADGMTLKLTGN